MLTPDQARMARAALDWGVRDLADKAGISLSTVARFESGRGGILGTSLEKMQRTLEAAGLVFIDNGQSGLDGAGPGVRFKDRR